MFEVVLMCGASGSGKSTWREVNYPNALVLSCDHFFMVDGEYRFDHTKLGEAQGWCLKRYVELVSNPMSFGGPPVVVDNTSTTLVELAPYVSLAQAYGVPVRIVVTRCPPEVAAARNTHKVPLDTVKRMVANVMDTLDHLPPYWPRPEMVFYAPPSEAP